MNQTTEGIRLPVQIRCARCTDIIEAGEHHGVGDHGQKLCYSCCGAIDREVMMRSGEIVLRLVKFADREWAALKVIDDGISAAHRYKIMNWSGTLVIQPFQTRKIVNFVGPDGYEWYGRRGTRERLYCKRRRVQALSFVAAVWTTQDGRKMPLFKLEPAHISNIIRKINRGLGSSNSGTRQWATVHRPYIEPLQKLLDVKRRRGDPERGFRHPGGILADVPPIHDVLALEAINPKWAGAEEELHSE